MSEKLEIHWTGTFIRGNATKDFNLDFYAADAKEATEVVSNYVDRLMSDGWYKKKDRLRALRVVSNG